MNTISEVFDAPLTLSAVADTKWRAICRTVPKSLEVYALLLCKPGNPLLIVDVDLPSQEVSGGKCTVDASDVVAAGQRASRDGLVVAGSVHRHPFGGSWLSGTDERLLEYMAVELASEMAVPVNQTRRPVSLSLRVNELSVVKSVSGRDIGPGTYTLSGVEIEETVNVSRVYCLVWSPGNGYYGASANVLYDPTLGCPRREYRYLPGLTVEKKGGKAGIDVTSIRRDARKLVRESHAWSPAGYEEHDTCSPRQ